MTIYFVDRKLETVLCVPNVDQLNHYTVRYNNRIQKVWACVVKRDGEWKDEYYPKAQYDIYRVEA